MKKLYISLLAIFSSLQIFAQNATISLPEMAVLYRGYDNKIVPVVGCNEQIELVCSEGATISKSTWSESGKQVNGYIVKVGNQNIITISLFGVSSNGTKTDYGTYNYRVKAFPKPELMTTTISKTTGLHAVLTLGTESPFTGVSFSILGGELLVGNETPFAFTGDVVPASALEKAKPGQKVSMVLRYNSNSGVANTITTMLVVMP